MAIALGMALHWIHIYLRPLHQALRLLWLLGVGGGVALAYQVGPAQMGGHPAGTTPLDHGHWSLLCCIDRVGLQGVSSVFAALRLWA